MTFKLAARCLPAGPEQGDIIVGQMPATTHEQVLLQVYLMLSIPSSCLQKARCSLLCVAAQNRHVLCTRTVAPWQYCRTYLASLYTTEAPAVISRC